MDNNVRRFVELLQADAAFREKVQDAIRNYSGEETAEAVFQKVFRPAAEEKGFRFTLEDMKAYIQEKTDSEQMLSRDELDQAAGGLAIGGEAKEDPNDSGQFAEALLCFMRGRPLPR